MKINIYNSDYLGLFTSTLCLSHCLATPLLFVAQTHTISCCEFLPFWWEYLTFFFIILSFFAVYYSMKKTSKKFMKTIFLSSWLFLSILLFNDLFELIYLPEFITYGATSLLAFLHIYNLKYCQCKDDKCCIHNF
ncbi:MAG: MerC domain-containing protein [Bacteroidota bacterium]|nr:MerC domain-containing protein [Bacteroidota bacterium]